MVQEGREVATIERGSALPAVGQQPEPLVVTKEYIEQTTKSLRLLRQMTRGVLQRDVDYGRVPGTGDFLWDPGASQIIGSFNCYAGHRRILSLTDDGKQISVVVEVPIISRLSGNEVGSGIGASSTQETKHKYRWEEHPEDWGYDEDAIKKFKTRTEDGKTKYRIPNPEHGELLNVVIKQASKRAEVDAAEGLPGVASALRELFSPKKGRAGGGAPGGEPASDQESGPKWTKFWGEVRALDLPEDAHVILRVSSMKEWLSQGRSLDVAVKVLALMKRGKSYEDAMKEAGTPSKQTAKSEWNRIRPEDVPNYDTLERLIERLCGKTPREMYRELGGGDRDDLAITPWEAFLQLKHLWAPVNR
jgi:hypothetical protein